MTQLQRQVGRARQRLMTNVVFERLALGVLIAAAAWTLVLLVERLFVLGLPLGWASLGAAGVVLVVTMVGVLTYRVTSMDAAVALDSAAGLKERCSTALICAASPDPFAKATLQDAEGKAGGIHVPTHLPLRAPRRWGWSVGLTGLAVLLTLIVPPMDVLARQEREEQELVAAQREEEKQQIATDVNRELEKLQKLAEQRPDLAALHDALAPLELPDKPGQTPDDIRRDAVRRLDDVQEKLAKQMESGELDMLAQLKKNLAQMDPLAGNDAASQLSKALAGGDFEGAQDALKKLQQQLDQAAKSSDPQQKQQAAELQAKLEQLAMKLEKLGDTAALRKELENKAGLSSEEAKQLMDKLTKEGQTDPKALEKSLQDALRDSKMSPEAMKRLARKIAQNNKACKSCQGLAQALAQAAQAAQQSDMAGGQGSGAGGAAGALSNAMGQISDMEMAEQLMNELEAQLSNIGDLQENLCDGGGGSQGEPRGVGPPGKNLGLGYGGGLPKEKAAHLVNPTRIGNKMGEGEIIGQVLIDGPQVPGDAQAKNKEAIAAAVREAEDAIEYERLPRQYHPAVQAYFDRLVGLGQANTPPEQPAEKQP